MLDTLTGAKAAFGRIPQRGKIIRQGVESVATAGVLGMLYGNTGLEVRKVPGDLVAGLASMAAAAMATPGQGFEPELSNIGASALSVYTFRKTAEFAARKKLAGGAVPGATLPKMAGDDYGDEWGNDSYAQDSWGQEDPIIEAARSL